MKNFTKISRALAAKKKLFLFIAATLLSIGAWGAAASLTALPSGTTSLASYSGWKTNEKTKNKVIYDDNNYFMIWSNGNNLEIDATGFKIGNSKKKSAMVFYVSQAANISVGIASNGSEATVSLHYMGASMDVLTDPNSDSEGGGTKCDEKSIAESGDSKTLSKSQGAAGFYKVFGTLRFYATSITVTPSALSAPTISAPTTDQSATYTVGDAITALSITASGNPTPTYQWYSNDSKSTTGATTIVGATSASYTPSNAAASDLYYYCVATNSQGTATSPYFHVTINEGVAAAPSFTSPASEPATAEYVVNQTINALNVVATGYPAPTYQWYSNDSKSTTGATLITGATSASYTPSNAAESDLYYYCVATNASGSVQSVYFHVIVEVAGSCYTFTSTNPAEDVTFDVNDIVPGSTGGSMKVVASTIKNTSNGVLFASNSSAKVSVTLTNLMKAGTVITATVWSNNNGSARTLKLNNASGTTKATWSFTPSSSSGESKEYSYTVVAGDGLENANEFQLQRGSDIYLRSLTVTNCGEELYTLSSAFDPVAAENKASITLDKTVLKAGATATATYNITDAMAYDFDEWVISGTGATIDDAKANPVTITMGTANATITLKLKAAAVKHTVTYYDGETKLGDELVVEGENPTGAGLTPTKFRYTFGGWSLTNGGDPIASYASVTVDADKNLYAVWNAIVCPESGEIFSLVADGTKAPSSNTYYPSTKPGMADLATYATVSGGKAQSVHTTSSNNPVQIQTSTSAMKLVSDDGYIRILLECPLQEGDTIKFGKDNKLKITYDSLKTAAKTVQLASGTNYYVVEAKYAGEDTIHVRKDGSNVTVTSVKVIRPVKYTVAISKQGPGTLAVQKQVGEEWVAIGENEKFLQGKALKVVATPADGGYVCNILSVLYNDGEQDQEIDLKALETDQFNMPAADVTVSASFGWPTAIDNTADEVKAVKFIENGQLLIEKNGHIYNAQGQVIR